MLTHIHIKNFTIVDELELDLRTGMTALTGETGAGKSILIDAIGLALGDRADNSFVRNGSERAEITLMFGIHRQKAVNVWLKDRELNSDDECIVRRVISHDGPSKGFINGSPAPMQSLRELGDMLVDIHGQHEHQSLMKTDAQRQILDDFAGNGELLEKLSLHYQTWKHAKQQMEQLGGSLEDRNNRIELLSYQVQELRALDLSKDELKTLEQDHKRLANASQLIETCQNLLNNLQDNDSTAVITLLENAAIDLQQSQQYEPRLEAIAGMINTAAIQAQEGARELRDVVDSLDIDPERLQDIDQRLGIIHDLARKHRVTAEELPDVLTRLDTELTTLEDAEGHLKKLQDKINNTESAYRDQAKVLSKKRQQAATRLAKTITDNMQQLGMPGGRFEVELVSIESESLSPKGLERVEFMVSANPGQPLKPLRKVASGGELSRISLAIQVVSAKGSRIPTLVFDEVDVGIGGGVAEIVGQQLRTLASNNQVCCVTHLAQVAAQAHDHLVINKTTAQNSTEVTVRPITDEDRTDEIARMLGGIKITAQTKAHAREMIAFAGKETENKKKAG